MPTQNSKSTGWDQGAFDNADRRGSRKKHGSGPDKSHDLLHLDFDAAHEKHVHGILKEHTRHTDSVHTHGDAAFVACAAGDAAGLHARLEPHFKAKNLPIRASHNTFTAGSDVQKNLASLKQG